MRIRLDELAIAAHGRITGASADPAAVITGVSIDSRQVRPSDAFFALSGEFHDGHDFVNAAFDSAAAVAVVQREVPQPPGPLVVTADVSSALAGVAGWVRDSLDPLVVGITGSNGKTTVKDFLASIARRKLRTVAAEKSFNNDLGVPLTLLRAGAETDVVVCEMGARGPGHIAKLCQYSRPQVGVVVNVGLTHFEKFGSIEAIAEAKSELVRCLPPGGTAVLNLDDPLVAAMSASTSANVLTFGIAETADVRATQVAIDSRGRASFVLSSDRTRIKVHLPLAGVHQVSNALAASAAALAVGIPLDQCRHGLEEVSASAWRMEVTEKSGVLFVNDAYNASPASMTSALQTCSAMTGPGGRLVAVFGHMAELGEISKTEHMRIGALAAGLAGRLVVVGEEAAALAKGASGAGMLDVHRAPDIEAAMQLIDGLSPGDVLLVKGSRVAGLEEVVPRAMTVVGAAT